MVVFTENRGVRRIAALYCSDTCGAVLQVVAVMSDDAVFRGVVLHLVAVIFGPADTSPVSLRNCKGLDVCEQAAGSHVSDSVCWMPPLRANG